MNIRIFVLLGGAFLFGQMVSLLPVVHMSGTLLDIAMLLLLGMSLWYRRKNKHSQVQFPRSFLWFAAIALASDVIRLMGNPWQINVIAWLYLLRWLIGTLLIFNLPSIPISEQSWVRFLGWLAVCFAALGFVQYVWYPDLRNIEYLGWDPHYFRLVSTLLDPNFAGLILTLGALVWLYLLERINTRIGVFIIGFLSLAVYLTFSRSSYLAYLTGLVLFIIIRRKVFKRVASVGMPLGLMGIFIGLVLLLPKPGGDTLLLTRMGSTISRIDNWRQSITLFQQSPIFGYGFNYTPYIPGSRLADQGRLSHAGGGVDNSYLLLLIMTGIPGLVTYLWFHAELANKALRLHSGFSALFLASQAAIAIHSIFVNSQFYPWVLLWYAILASVLFRKIGK